MVDQKPILVSGLERALKPLLVDLGQQWLDPSEIPKFLGATKPQLILHLDVL